MLITFVALSFESIEYTLRNKLVELVFGEFAQRDQPELGGEL